MVKKIFGFVERAAGGKTVGAAVLLLLVVGIFLRVFHLGDWLQFGADEARDVEVIQMAWQSRSLIWLGPESSIGHFSLGPFFYYLLAPAVLFSTFHPASGAWVVVGFGILTLPLIYFAGRKLWDETAGVIAMGLYAVSGLVVAYTRWSWNPNLLPFFVLLFLMALWLTVHARELRTRQWALIVAAAAFGIGVQLHASTLFTLPIIALGFLLWERPRGIQWPWWAGAVGTVFVFHAPLMVFELRNQFENTRGLLGILNSQEPRGEWMPSIIATLQHLRVLTVEIVEFPKQWPILVSLLMLAGVVGLGMSWRRNLLSKPQRTAGRLLVLWLGSFLAVTLFRVGPIFPHFVAMMFPVPMLLLGVAGSILLRQRMTKFLFLLCFGLLTFSNIVYQLERFEVLDRGGDRSRAFHDVTLKEQTALVDELANLGQNEDLRVEINKEPVYGRSLRFLYRRKTGQALEDGFGAASALLVCVPTSSCTEDAQTRSRQLLYHIGNASLWSPSMD